jgi:four helix bundle protein
MSLKTPINKIEDSPLWKMVNEVATESHKLVSDLPEEEKWGLQSKLRQRSVDASQDIAEALGSIDPRDRVWHYGLARRDLFGIKNAIRFAHTAGYIKLNPDIMVQIDKAVTMLDNEVTESEADIKQWYDTMSNPQSDTTDKAHATSKDSK